MAINSDIHVRPGSGTLPKERVNRISAGTALGYSGGPVDIANASYRARDMASCVTKIILRVNAQQ